MWSPVDVLCTFALGLHFYWITFEPIGFGSVVSTFCTIIAVYSYIYQNTPQEKRYIYQDIPTGMGLRSGRTVTYHDSPMQTSASPHFFGPIQQARTLLILLLLLAMFRSSHASQMPHEYPPEVLVDVDVNAVLSVVKCVGGRIMYDAFGYSDWLCHTPFKPKERVHLPFKRDKWVVDECSRMGVSFVCRDISCWSCRMTNVITPCVDCQTNTGK